MYQWTISHSEVPDYQKLWTSHLWEILWDTGYLMAIEKGKGSLVEDQVIFFGLIVHHWILELPCLRDIQCYHLWNRILFHLGEVAGEIHSSSPRMAKWLCFLCFKQDHNPSPPGKSHLFYGWYVCPVMAGVSHGKYPKFWLMDDHGLTDPTDPAIISSWFYDIKKKLPYEISPLDCGWLQNPAPVGRW